MAIPALNNISQESPDSVPGRRFGGLERLYGVPGAQTIRDAHVAVIGLGGVGSWAAEALARSGMGRLTLVDLDNVSESNINRQLHALTDTIGQPKVDAMRARIAQINPCCQVDVVEDFLDADNAAAILGRPGLSAVIDACDQVKAKLAICSYMLAAGRPFIVAGAAGGRTLAHKVEIEDLGLLTHDRLLAQLRYRLRRQLPAGGSSKAMHVPCVFSREPVRSSACELQTDSSLNCAGYGSSVAVTASFGMAAAGWVLNKLTNFPQ